LGRFKEVAASIKISECKHRLTRQTGKFIITRERRMEAKPTKKTQPLKLHILASKANINLEIYNTISRSNDDIATTLNLKPEGYTLALLHQRY